MVETTDLIFAVDSIPAIFGVTRKPFIVFTSNVFAILGLRSMYFVLAGAIGFFRYLKVGLSVMLVFIGVKMLIDPHDLPPRWFQYDIPDFTGFAGGGGHHCALPFWHRMIGAPDAKAIGGQALDSHEISLVNRARPTAARRTSSLPS